MRLDKNSPQEVGEEDDEPLRRVGEDGGGGHEEEEDDQQDVRHRQEDQQPVEVRVLAPFLFAQWERFTPNQGI